MLPKIAVYENIQSGVTGGWMVYLSELLSRMENIRLIYVFDWPEPLHGEVDGVEYFSIAPIHSKIDFKKYQTRFSEIITISRPDIIHIWGSENAHTDAIVRCTQHTEYSQRTIISMQGLLSSYEKNYAAFLPRQVVYGLKPVNLIKGNIHFQQLSMRKSGKFEVDAFRRVKHVIGRTDWDYATVTAINAKINYHFNNEILRKEFYGPVWNIDTCHRHTIFCSQAHYPIKGIHLMIEALHLLKEKYPDVLLRVSGKNLSAKSRLRRGAYEAYVLNEIRRFRLEPNVEFLGPLSAEQMRDTYLSSHVFVCPSTIENSPNSVGEAMSLGVPVVSSYVGGVKNLLVDGSEGLLYPSDEVSMLALYLDRIFSDDSLAKKFSKNARMHAKKTFDPKTNVEALMKIYEQLIEG